MDVVEMSTMIFSGGWHIVHGHAHTTEMIIIIINTLWFIGVFYSIAKPLEPVHYSDFTTVKLIELLCYLILPLCN